MHGSEMVHQSCQTTAAPARRAAVARRGHPEVTMRVMMPIHASEEPAGPVRRRALRRCHSRGRERGGRAGGRFAESASAVMSHPNRLIPAQPGPVSSGLIRLNPTYGNVPSRQTGRGLAQPSGRGPGGAGGRVRRQPHPPAEAEKAWADSDPVKPSQTKSKRIRSNPALSSRTQRRAMTTLISKRNVNRGRGEAKMLPQPTAMGVSTRNRR
jgi:hypothetical protein